jgi:hypothetical protein
MDALPVQRERSRRSTRRFRSQSSGPAARESAARSSRAQRSMWSHTISGVRCGYKTLWVVFGSVRPGRPRLASAVGLPAARAQAPGARIGHARTLAPASRLRRRFHSNPGPGSRLRPGATCSWPTISSIGQCAVSSRIKRPSCLYCRAVKLPPSSPSSSIPSDQSLQLSRPRHEDTPACQARSSQPTNCRISPSRRTKKCAETCSPRRPSKYA